MSYQQALIGPRARAAAIAAIRSAPEGYVVRIDAPKRSLEQNALMWAKLNELSAGLPWDGEHLTATEYKDLLTACLRKQKVVRGIEGGLVFLGSRTSAMTVSEMRDLLDLIDAFAAQRGFAWSTEMKELTP